MAPVKIPAAKRNMAGAYICPFDGCIWFTEVRTSYYRHYDVHHSKSFRYVCPVCGGGQHRLNLHLKHVNKKNCGEEAEDDIGRRGRKLTIVSDRQYRAAHGAAPKEEVQELEETLEEVEREKEKLEEKNRKLEAENMELKQENFRLEAIVEKLQERVKIVDVEDPVLPEDLVDQVMGPDVEGPMVVEEESDLGEEVYEEPAMEEDEEVQVQGEEVVLEGEGLVREGEELVLEGGELVVDGEEVVLEGEQLVPEGEKMVLEGEEVVMDGEKLVMEGEVVVTEGEELVLKEDEWSLMLSETEDEEEEEEVVQPGSPLLLNLVPLVPSPPQQLRRSGRVPAKEKERRQLALVLATSDPAGLGLVVKETTSI